MESNKDQQMQLWSAWNSDRNKGNMSALLTSFKPLIENEVHKHTRTGKVPPSIVRAEAYRQTSKAINSYDPSKKAIVSTWVVSHLRKVNRVAAPFQTAVSIPEARRLRITNYNEAVSRLRDEMNREPSAQDLADELSWPIAEIARIRKELRGEVVDTKDLVLTELGRDEGPDVEMAMRYVYPELEPMEKQVFEFTFGYGGQKPIDTNSGIAQQVGVSESSVRNIKNRIGIKMEPFLNGM